MTLQDWRTAELKPGHCAIKCKPQAEETKGGIILAERYQYYQWLGEVVNVNPNGKPVDFGVGDSVLFQRWAGAQFVVDDSKDMVCMLKCDNVLAIYEPEGIEERDPVYGVLVNPCEDEPLIPGFLTESQQNQLLENAKDHPYLKKLEEA